MPKINVIWMDDDSQPIQNYSRLLKLENASIDINIIESPTIEKTRKLLMDESIDSLIIDCKMDKYDRSMNGALFLSEINSKKRCFPTFVFSGFLRDPDYSDILRRSYAIMIESKSVTFETPISKSQFFSKLIHHSTKYRKLKDIKPEEILFSAYIKDPNKYKKIVSVHWEKHGNWINKELTRNDWQWAVVCGEQIVAYSKDIFNYPEEKDLINIGKRFNLIPFAYSSALLSEESVNPSKHLNPWNRTKYVEDYYPTITAIANNIEVSDDFDTGAFQTVISSDFVKQGAFDFIRGIDINTHLGGEYRYYTKKINISIEDTTGKKQIRPIPVQVVKDWGASPFVQINPKRRILFGRDILRAFALEIRLDSKRRISELLFLD